MIEHGAWVGQKEAADLSLQAEGSDLPCLVARSPFHFQQPGLALRGAEGAPAAGAGGRHHAVAGHEDEDGIGLHGPAHGPGRAGPPQPQGHIPVAEDLPGSRRPQHLGHFELEGRQL